MAPTTELEELAERAADLDLNLHEISRRRNEPQSRMNVIRAQFILEIGLAKDGDGKQVYRNDKLRDAALTLKLAESEEYQQLLSKSRELSVEYDQVIAERNKLGERRRTLLMELGQQNVSSGYARDSATPQLWRTPQEIEKLRAMFEDIFDNLNQPEIGDDIDYIYLSNFADALNWFTGSITTENFLSEEYMNLARLQRIRANQATETDLPIPRLVRPGYGKDKMLGLSPLQAENVKLRQSLAECQGRATGGN